MPMCIFWLLWKGCCDNKAERRRQKLNIADKKKWSSISMEMTWTDLFVKAEPLAQTQRKEDFCWIITQIWNLSSQTISYIFCPNDYYYCFCQIALFFSAIIRHTDHCDKWEFFLTMTRSLRPNDTYSARHIINLFINYNFVL